MPTSSYLSFSSFGTTPDGYWGDVMLGQSLGCAFLHHDLLSLYVCVLTSIVKVIHIH